jgi:hypothetical protein
MGSQSNILSWVIIIETFTSSTWTWICTDVGRWISPVQLEIGTSYASKAFWITISIRTPWAESTAVRTLLSSSCSNILASHGIVVPSWTIGITIGISSRIISPIQPTVIVSNAANAHIALTSTRRATSFAKCTLRRRCTHSKLPFICVARCIWAITFANWIANYARYT